MIEIHELPTEPVALTIGMFDGVHLGHQMLLKRLKETGKKTAVLTFANHPLSFFFPDRPLLPITTHEQKKRLLEHFGVDLLITIRFDAAFASITYDQLLNSIPLTHLILGKGAAFGKNREGTEEKVRAWAENKAVRVEYLPKLTFNHEPVSSSAIRKALLSNDRLKAQELLGYPLTYLEDPHA